MKNETKLLTRSVLAIGAGLLLGACSRNDSAQTTASNDVENAAESIGDATRSTWNDVKDYTYEKRTELADRVERDYDSMRSNVANSDVKQRLDAAGDRLKEAARDVRNATAENWDQAKDRLQMAWNDVRTATANAAE